MGNEALKVKGYIPVRTLKTMPSRCNIGHAAALRWRARLKFRHNPPFFIGGSPMAQDDVLVPKTKIKPKVEKPKLYKVILFNDDYTPREFVIMILQAVFRTGESAGYHIMITAHQKGSCVIAVYTKDVAETKVAEAMDHAKDAGFPLMLTAEPEE
jgi:ATP-dependent Clp protease adaptor protein ClpS